MRYGDVAYSISATVEAVGTLPRLLTVLEVAEVVAVSFFFLEVEETDAFFFFATAALLLLALFLVPVSVLTMVVLTVLLPL
jgi:hypothetical protein